MILNLKIKINRNASVNYFNYIFIITQKMFVYSRLMRQMGPQAKFVAQNQRMIFSKFFGTTASTNPQVYFEISKDSQPIGKLVFELYMDKTPITAENFRSICAGDGKQGYTYAGSHFHRIIDGFMAQGGDFTRHNGTGGKSIYGENFADEPSALKLKHTERG